MGTSELESLLAEKQKLLTDLSQEEKNLLQLEQSGEDAQMDAPLVFHKDAKKDALKDTQKDVLKDAESKQSDEDAQMNTPLDVHKDGKKDAPMNPPKDAQKDAQKDAEGKQNKQKISPSQRSKSQGTLLKSYLYFLLEKITLL